MTDPERRCVLPFYLKMMGLNALTHNIPFDALREVAQGAADDEIGKLLGSSWRPRVMGAWLASGRTRRLEAPLLRSLETSAGTLTAPPLATVALYGLGVKAVPSLETYLRQDLEHEWGAASFVAAVLERLAATPAGVAIDDRDRSAVDGMLMVSRRIAETKPEIPPDAAT